MTDRQAIDGAAGAAITHQPDKEKRMDNETRRGGDCREWRRL